MTFAATQDQNKIWEFKSPEKQRVSDYLRQKPSGTFDDFRKFGKRAFLVSKAQFEDVLNTLQERGALQTREGSRAARTLEDKLREEILKEYRLNGIIPKETELPPPVLEALEPAAPAALPEPAAPKQAPLAFPNESSLTQTTKEEPMAKPSYTLRQMPPEQRKKFDEILSKHRQIGYDDLMAKLETFTIPKTVFYATMHAIKTNKYTFGEEERTASRSRGGSAAAAKAAAAPTPAPANGNGKLPFVNVTRLAPGQIEIIKRLDSDTFDEADLKWIQTKGPSFLSHVLGSKMAFKIVKISEDDGDGNMKTQLEVRRIQ